MMKRHIIHVLCSPHGGIATYVQGIIEAEKYNGNYSTIILNFKKADKQFLSNLNKSSNSNKLNKLYNLNTHKIPNLKTIFDIIELIKLIFKYKFDDKNKLYLFAHGTSSAGISLISSIITRIQVFYIPHGGLSHLYTSNNKILYNLAKIYDTLLKCLNVKFLYESLYTSLLYMRIENSKQTIENSTNYLYSFPSNLYNKIKKNIYLEAPSLKNQLEETNYNSRITISSKKDEKHFLNFVYMGTWRKIKGSIRLLNVLSTFNQSDFILKNGKLITFTFYTDIERHKIINPHPEYISIKPWNDNPQDIISKSYGQIIPSEGESFGYAAIEAQLGCLPVIHTNQGGLKEIFEGTKFPIIPTTFIKKDLLEAIEYITTNSFNDMIKKGVFFKSSIAKSAWNPDKMFSIFK